MKKLNARAFTLIELLVVIAIIAILAAILFPVFAQAKLAAKKTSDLSNMKQIATGLIMYGNDNEDMTPSQNPDVNGFPNWTAGSGLPEGFMDVNAPQNWAASMYPYIKNLPIYKSPGVIDTPGGVPWSVVNDGKAGNSTYAMNGAIHYVSLTSFSDPAQTIAFQGKDATTRESTIQPTRFNAGGTFICNGIDLNWIGASYGKGANYAWSEGHAGFKLRTAVTFRNFGVYSDVNAIRGGATGPNTTGLTDPILNTANYWWTWGACDVSRL